MKPDLWLIILFFRWIEISVLVASSVDNLAEISFFYPSKENLVGYQFNTSEISDGARKRTKRNAICATSSLITDAATGATLGSIGGPIGAGFGLGFGLIGGVIKTITGNTGCEGPDSSDIFRGVNEVHKDVLDIQTKVGDISTSVSDLRSENAIDHKKTQSLINDLDLKTEENFEVTRDLISRGQVENRQEFAITQEMIKQGNIENMQNFAQTKGLVNLGRLENSINFKATQELISAGQAENRVSFGKTQGLVNLGRLENFANFAETKGLIQEGRKENLANFVKTFDLINVGRMENQVNFKVTQDLINVGRLENFAGFAKTQGLIQEGRQENLVNFAITQDLINTGREENRINFGVTQGLINLGRQENLVNFQVTRDLINLGREENLANFRATRDLINVGREENLVNFAVTQDMIAQGRWENLANFQAVKGAIRNLHEDTLKGFSLLTQLSDRNLNAITNARLENAHNFKTTFQLLDRNQEAINAGRIENFKNFKMLQGFITQVNDNLLKTAVESKAERFLYFSSTASIINETGIRVENSVNEAKIEILKAIDKSRLEPILSSIATFSSYFDSELKDLSSFSEEKLVQKLLEPNGILFTLVESRSPREVNSLHSLMSDIINQNLAVPKSRDDEDAFIVLDSLLSGVELYLEALDFILGSYQTLAKHFNVKMDLESVKKYVILAEVRYTEFVRSLGEGLLTQIEKVLSAVQSSGFVDDDQRQVLKKAFQKIREVRANLVEQAKYIKDLSLVPTTITSKPIFPALESGPTVGQWFAGNDVSYAVQYRIGRVFTRVADFSSKFVLSAGLRNPTITLPRAPSEVDERFIYRQFGNADPEYIGSVPGSSPVSFVDIDRDLYNAAGQANENVGLPQVEHLLDQGANGSVIMNDGKNALHVAAEQDNQKIVALLISKLQGSQGFDLKGRLPVHITAEVGNVGVFDTILRLGGDVNALSSFGLTPLQVAAMFGKEDVVKFLRGQTGVDWNGSASDQFLPLHLAVIGGHRAVVRELLNTPGVDLNAKDGDNFTALHHAISSKDRLIFDDLLSISAIDVNFKTATGLTPLHLATVVGVVEFVEKLLSHPSVVKNAKTDNGFTVLHLAAVNNRTTVTQSILKRAPTLTNAKNDNGQTALHLAVAMQNAEVVKILILEGKADVNAVDNDGMTPVHIAASIDQTELIAMMMLVGASTSTRSKLGFTPLHYAVWYGKSAVVEALLKEGNSDSNELVDDDRRLSPLHLAVVANQIDSVRILLNDKNIDVNSRTDSMTTPLHLAAALGRDQIVTNLTQATGIHLFPLDKFSKFPLDYAKEFGHGSIAEFLAAAQIEKIDWQSAPDSDWAPMCDFKLPYFAAKQVRVEECGNTCVSTPGCSHFAWTDFEGGTCWMKKGPVKKEDAHPTSDPSMVCGIVKLYLKINWNSASDSTWALSCDFTDEHFKAVRTINSQCGPACVSERTCTHFAWTNFEDGTCWLKSGPTSRENAMPNDNPSMVCGLLSEEAMNSKITWQVAPDSEWANGCDFEKPHFESVQVPPEKCGLVCVSIPDCSHFAWTSHQGGTCWLKSGTVSKGQAFPTDDAFTVCGIRNPDHVIRWNTATDAVWSHGCDFPSDDLFSVQTMAEDCGPRCASTESCAKFTWSLFNGGTCFLKSGRASKIDAISTGDSSMVCGITLSQA